MGQHGARLIASGQTVLTHCNAGALGDSRLWHGIGRHSRGLGAGEADSGHRRRNQAGFARRAAHGLGVDAGQDSSDAHHGQYGRRTHAAGKIHLCIVGADRIAANGDVANKIGTYSVAVLAKAHGIPFYVAAPYSTIDLKTKTGADIPIEQRNPVEVTTIHGSHPVAPAGVAVYNPAFDVTPAELITGIITERGVFRPDELAAQFQS